jgi:primosomal protein N' (replication factor Y)
VSRKRMSERYIGVIVDVPAVGDREFTYSLPEEIALPRGAKVRVPFASSHVDGYVVGDAAHHAHMGVKSVEYVYDLDFLPDADLLDLGERLAAHYCDSIASLWSCLWPPVAPKKSVARIMKEGGFSEAAPPFRSGESQASPTPIALKPVPELVWGRPSFRWKRYLAAVREALSSGKGVIFLTPEVRNLGEALERLAREAPGEVCSLHSEMTGVTRRGAWLSLAKGEKRVAVGTRSAVFAPVRDLGLIVVDDEPSTSYKSLERPFYSAQTVARYRARSGARVLFGASHPSVGAFWHAREEGWASFTEEVRPHESLTREVVFLDMRDARPSREIISGPMKSELEKAFSSGKRAVLFLNRRGDSSQVSCRDCGSAIICPKCGVPLSHHAKEGQMVCHTCGYREEAPVACPTCGGHRWRMSGAGIEKAEAEFKKKFPGTEVFRLDVDASKTVSPDETVRRFGRSSPSCLLATQMVLGMRLPGDIGFVGVLSADTALSLPDFRASERAYQILARLGDLVVSTEDFRGTYMIQTRNPDHHAVRGVTDRFLFYETELQHRRMLGYPPFREIFKVRFGGKTFERVKDTASMFARLAESDDSVRVLGPVPAPKPRVRGVHWWQIALRGEDHEAMAALCRRAVSLLPRTSAVRVVIDVEPVDME